MNKDKTAIEVLNEDIRDRVASLQTELEDFKIASFDIQNSVFKLKALLEELDNEMKK